MELNTAFGLALKQVRKRQQLTQEDFSSISSRTYLSTLERGLKSPTLEKLEQLSSVLNVHPLTMMVVAYLHKENRQNVSDLLKNIETELASLSPNDTVSLAHDQKSPSQPKAYPSAEYGSIAACAYSRSGCHGRCNGSLSTLATLQSASGVIVQVKNL